MFRQKFIFKAAQSGAKATALQTLTRLPSALEPREAFGVRRVHRRFGASDALHKISRLSCARKRRRRYALPAQSKTLSWLPNAAYFLMTLMLLIAATMSRAADLPVIKPGEVWPDDRGQHVQAHGGGILKLGDMYYWFGEDRSMGNSRSNRYVACYSSTNLAQWTFRRQVVKLTDPEDLGRGWVLERPKVFYNEKTKKFVMYAHIDGKGGYKFASVAVFTCDTVDGDYQYLKSFRPLDHESRDIGQFVDDDGSAYLIFEDRPYGFRIAKLSDDYLAVEKQVCLISQHLEGGALVHYNGLYYVIGSHLSGWDPNPNVYATAKSLEGPWSDFKDIAPSDAKTYGSQSTMMLKVVGTKTTTVIFMGDIWHPWAQWGSRYLWMPLQIGDGKLWLPEPKPWTLDIKTGEATVKEP